MKFSKLFSIAVFMSFIATSALACKCRSYKHLLETAEVSEHVVIGRLLEVTRIDSTSKNTKFGLRGKLMICRVIKGTITSETIEIIGGYYKDCLYSLLDLELKKEYLFLLKKDYGLSVCGHTLLAIDEGMVQGKISKTETQNMPIDQVVAEIKKKNGG